MTGNPLTTEQVARRLGVQRATIYAYVSRGLLSRTVAPDGRTSLFDPEEVEALGRRGRPRRAATRTGTVEVVLTSAITRIELGRLAYRGVDVAELAATGDVEGTAEWLWATPEPPPAPWTLSAEVRDAVGRACAALPPDAPATLRAALGVATAAALDPARGDLRPDAVRARGRVLLTALPHTLAPVRATTDPAAPTRVVDALWPRVSPLRPTPARTRALATALVALADHELATSTLAARVAASTRANPYSCVLAAIGAVSGPLHGRAAVRTQRVLADTLAGEDPATTVATAIDEHGRVPGFGHPLYDGVDPRAEILLDHVGAIASPTVLDVVTAVRAATARATGEEPDVDFALAALALAVRMPVGATEALFVVARTVGWIAHVIEEYEERALRFRARSIYTGPEVARPDGVRPGR